MAETILNSHYKGDTFNGTAFTITVNNAAPDNLLSSVVLTVRPQPSSSTKYQLSSGSGMTITDAVNWEFRIDPQIINWPAFNYYYDIQCTDSEGNVKTYIYGRWLITQDVTY
jgi:hypothetical protein